MFLDTVKRILNVVLKMRYDLKTLAQKQNNMDEIITEIVVKIKSNEISIEETASVSNQDQFASYQQRRRSH